VPVSAAYVVAAVTWRVWPVRCVNLPLKVVRQNDGGFVDLILL
jgi:hypothetical protein